MAAEAAGSRENAEWGYKPDSTNVVKIATVNVGFLRGDVESTLPRAYAFMQLDQDILDIDAVCSKKDWLISFGMDEVLQVNLQNAWDNDAPGGGVVTVDDDMRGVVAVAILTDPPADDGGDTRTLAMPTALSIGDGAYAIPNARTAAIQGVGAQFKAIAAPATALLGTVTDAYA